MIVIVPSRNRPLNVADLIEAWKTTQATAQLFIAVNNDDESIESYHKLLYEDAPDNVRWLRVPNGSTMVSALNYVAPRCAAKQDIVGFMGDDHRPRTVGWDETVRRIMRDYGPSVVYGDDRLQGANLPTHVFLPAEFVVRRRHMAPATLTHLYVDNYWLELGRRAGALHYAPEIVIEHMHPVAGKADWDEGYKRVNAGQLYHDDSIAYQEYAGGEAMRHDVEVLDELRERWSD